MYNVNDVLVWHFPYKLENNAVLVLNSEVCMRKKVMHVIGHRNV